MRSDTGEFSYEDTENRRRAGSLRLQRTAYGDVFDRFLVRVHEVYQSLDIIDKIMAGLPEGDIMWEKNLNKVLAFLKKAEGTGWASIEAPRGDDTHVVHR